MKPVLECPQVAVFSEQGEVIGKTKGRKKRLATDKAPETAPRKCPKGPKAQGKSNSGGAGDAETVEPAETRKQKSKGKKPEVDVPPLESLKDTVQPPLHVNSGTVYSNAYRKFQSQHGKEDVEGAQKTAQLASAIFQAYGVVPQEYIGKFLDKPRTARKTPTPQQKAGDKDADEEDGSKEDSHDGSVGESKET